MMSIIDKISEEQSKRFTKKGITNSLIACSLLIALIFGSWRIGYYIWPNQITQKLQFLTISSVAINVGTQIIALLLYLPGYMKCNSYYQKYRINKEAISQWERKQWPQNVRKIAKSFIISQIIVYPITVYFFFKYIFQANFDNFPTFPQFGLHLLFIYYLDDLLFFIAHYASHKIPLLYRAHKVHHEFDVVFVLVGEYFHPLEFMLGLMLPAIIPTLILGSSLHYFTFFFWIFYKAIFGLENHSGYEFEWSPFRILPLIANSSFHDNHHRYNIGNFGSSCYLWDIMFDTFQTAPKGY